MAELIWFLSSKRELHLAIMESDARLTIYCRELTSYYSYIVHQDVEIKDSYQAVIENHFPGCRFLAKPEEIPVLLFPDQEDGPGTVRAVNSSHVLEAQREMGREIELSEIPAGAWIEGGVESFLRYLYGELVVDCESRQYLGSLSEAVRTHAARVKERVEKITPYGSKPTFVQVMTVFHRYLREAKLSNSMDQLRLAYSIFGPDKAVEFGSTQWRIHDSSLPPDERIRYLDSFIKLVKRLLEEVQSGTLASNPIAFEG